MTTTEVQRSRALAPAGAIFEVLCDNNLIYYAGPVGDYEFIWDDTNGCFYQLRPNVSPYTQVESPVEVLTVSYDHIQRITFKLNFTETMKFLKDVGRTEEQVNATISKLNVLNGTNRNTTHVQTTEGYADGHVAK